MNNRDKILSNFRNAFPAYAGTEIDCNLYGDIIAGGKIIATSDLSHDLSSLGVSDMPTSWKLTAAPMRRRSGR